MTTADAREDLRSPEILEKLVSLCKRRGYRRMGETGTPYCITVDGDTMSDGTVTVRERDCGNQSRVAVAEVVDMIKEAMKIG